MAQYLKTILIDISFLFWYWSCDLLKMLFNIYTQCIQLLLLCFWNFAFYLSSSISATIIGLIIISVHHLIHDHYHHYDHHKYCKQARAVSCSPRQQRQVMGRPIVHSSVGFIIAVIIVIATIVINVIIVIVINSRDKWWAGQSFTARSVISSLSSLSSLSLSSFQPYSSVALPIWFNKSEQVVQEGDGRHDATVRDWYVMFASSWYQKISPLLVLTIRESYLTQIFCKHWKAPQSFKPLPRHCSQTNTQ